MGCRLTTVALYCGHPVNHVGHKEDWGGREYQYYLVSSVMKVSISSRTWRLRNWGRSPLDTPRDRGGMCSNAFLKIEKNTKHMWNTRLLKNTQMSIYVCVCMCVCVRACVRACVRVCVLLCLLWFRTKSVHVMLNIQKLHPSAWWET